MAVKVDNVATGADDVYATGAGIGVREGNLFVFNEGEFTLAIYAPGEWRHAEVVNS